MQVDTGVCSAGYCLWSVAAHPILQGKSQAPGGLPTAVRLIHAHFHKLISHVWETMHAERTMADYSLPSCWVMTWESLVLISLDCWLLQEYVELHQRYLVRGEAMLNEWHIKKINRRTGSINVKASRQRVSLCADCLMT